MRIVNATVVLPDRGVVERDQVIDIEDGAIAAIGPASKASRPEADKEVIDAKGSYVLPGLIDAHVHLSSFADSHDHELLGVTNATIAESAVRGAFSGLDMLRRGVTAVRDVGCKHSAIFALKAWFDAHPEQGPRTVVAGAGITVTGGAAHRSSADEVDSSEELIRAVRQRVKLGADLIKVFVSDGVLHPAKVASTGYYSAPQLRSVVEMAHALGRKVAAHTTDAESCRAAVLAGVDSIEHGHDIEPEILERMAAQGVFLVPTLWHYRRVALDGAALGYANPIVEQAKIVADVHAATFLRAVEAGVPIATGTDSGSPRYGGGAMAAELRYMGELGVDPLVVLRWATADAARCLGIHEVTGTLARGMRADMVAFRDAPTSSLKALEDPWLVLRDGRIARVDPSA